jgi:transposase
MQLLLFSLRKDSYNLLVLAFYGKKYLSPSKWQCANRSKRLDGLARCHTRWAVSQQEKLLSMTRPDQAVGVPSWAPVIEHSRLSDEQWRDIEHLFRSNDAGRGRSRRSDREILDAILWVETNNERWHRLPSCYPPQQTCYAKYVVWRRDGLLAQVKEALRAEVMPPREICSAKD